MYFEQSCENLPMDDVWARIAQVIALKIKGCENEAAWLRKAGMSNGYFTSRRSEIAKGKSPGLGTAATIKLAKAANIRAEWLLSGTGPMREGEPILQAPTTDGSRLLLEMARCTNAALREALIVFWNQDKSEPARHAITHFLYASHKDLKKMAVEDWLDELKGYAARVRKGLSPLGDGAREMEDDE